MALSRQSVADRPKSTTVTRPKIADTPPVKGKLEGVEIENPAQFMLDNGIVFELNRIIFHQLGLALSVIPNGKGKLELALFDCTANPTTTFDPVTFKRGQSKWRHYYHTKGMKASQTREKKLGFTTQTQPDYREQLKAV